MTYNLFLDDERMPSFIFVPAKNPVTNTSPAPVPAPLLSSYPFPHSWLIVRSYIDFCDTVRDHGLPDYLSLDHDLGTSHTGLDCVHYLIDYMLNNDLREFPQYYVHSANPVGKENIIGLIESFKRHLLAAQ